MNALDLKKWINSLTQDITFQYKGKTGSICPFSPTDISLSYDGEEISVDSVDKAMKIPFINGKSLEGLCQQLFFE